MRYAIGLYTMLNHAEHSQFHSSSNGLVITLCVNPYSELENITVNLIANLKLRIAGKPLSRAHSG